jgi:hypothetical protein
LFKYVLNFSADRFRLTLRNVSNARYICMLTIHSCPSTRLTVYRFQLKLIKMKRVWHAFQGCMCMTACACQPCLTNITFFKLSQRRCNALQILAICRMSVDYKKEKSQEGPSELPLKIFICMQAPRALKTTRYWSLLLLFTLPAKPGALS